MVSEEFSCRPHCAVGQSPGGGRALVPAHQVATGRHFLAYIGRPSVDTCVSTCPLRWNQPDSRNVGPETGDRPARVIGKRRHPDQPSARHVTHCVEAYDMNELATPLIAFLSAFVAVVFTLPILRHHLTARPRRLATIAVVAIAVLLVVLGVAVLFME